MLALLSTGRLLPIYGGGGSRVGGAGGSVFIVCFVGYFQSVGPWGSVAEAVRLPLGLLRKVGLFGPHL